MCAHWMLKPALMCSQKDASCQQVSQTRKKWIGVTESPLKVEKPKLHSVYRVCIQLFICDPEWKSKFIRNLSVYHPIDQHGCLFNKLIWISILCWVLYLVLKFCGNKTQHEPSVKSLERQSGRKWEEVGQGGWLSLGGLEKISGGRASKLEFRDAYECVCLAKWRQADGNYLSQVHGGEMCRVSFNSE